jgi:hypothetical protein
MKSGDTVKILPEDAAGKVDVVKVEYVGPTLVAVSGGRWFFLRDGRSLDPSAKLHIEPANEAQPAD